MLHLFCRGKGGGCRQSKLVAPGPQGPPAAVPDGSTWHKNGGAELEPLLEFTTLIDVRWLLKVAEGEVTCVDEKGDQLPMGVVPAWQQLPDEAKARLEQMWTSKMEYGLPVGVLSYGWASRVC